VIAYLSPLKRLQRVDDGRELAPQHPEAVVIYEIDPVTDTILVGHYCSEEVDRGGPEINAWIEALGHRAQTQ
jgi:hypothetical protein